jgi:DnaK suppressor protein
MNTAKPAAKADPKLANAWKTKAGRDLTEAELLAMPEAEYMNEQQIDFFRVRLQAQKDDLLSNAGETTEHLREDTTIVPDPADRATIEEEHALELRTRDRERKLLKKISQALNRLDTGEYGFCDETGEPIGLPPYDAMGAPLRTVQLELIKEIDASILVTSFRAKQPWVLAKFTDIVPTVPSIMTWPSGAARATNSVPMIPPAPVRFSTVTG